MKKELLNEINRMRDIMSLPALSEQNFLFNTDKSNNNIINEQSWVDNLAQFGSKRIQNLDDIVKSMGKMGETLTDIDIDKICDDLVEYKYVTKDLADKLRKQLKTEKNLRDSLSNGSDDFVSKVKQAAKKVETKEADEFVNSLNVLRLLNKEQMLSLIRKQIKNMLTVADSAAKTQLTKIDDLISGSLKKMYDNGNVFYNVDEIWDITDGFINNILEDSTGYISEGLFLEYSSALRSSSKIKDLVDKIKVEKLDAAQPKRTPSVSYGKEYVFPEEWFQTSKWKQYKTIKNADGTDIQVAVTKPKSTDLATDISKTADEVEEIPVTNPKIKIGNTSEETIFNFLGKGGIFREKAINIIRELLDEVLADKQKLYITTLSPKGIQDFKNILGILKEKYGELNKIYVSNLEGIGNKRMTIDDFEKYIEGSLETTEEGLETLKGGYKRIYDSEGNFSPLNKLDTNYVDGPNQIIELMKTTLTKDEIDNFADIIKRLSTIPEKEVLQKTLTMIELENKWSEIIIKLKNNSKDAVGKWYENVNEITKKIKSASLKGDASEIKATELMESKGMKVIYTASEGDPVDSLLNIDHIVDDISNNFGGGIKTVQTKSASYIKEGEFRQVTKTNKKGETSTKWMFVETPGTGRYMIGTTEKIGKQSQIDLSAFSDDAGNTIVCGRQKEWVGYDDKGLPIFSEKEILPGSVSRSNKPFQIYIVDPGTTKIFSKL